jgi:hypothetical protein
MAIRSAGSLIADPEPLARQGWSDLSGRRSLAEQLERGAQQQAEIEAQ